MLDTAPFVPTDRFAPVAEGPRSMTALVQRVAATRDTEAFAQLFLAYAPRLKSYMMRQGTDPHTAEELAQETLFAVWRKAGLYSDDKGSATTWIFTIARNLRIDRLRREQPWQELPQDRENEASGEPRPDELVCGHEQQQRVRSALEYLPGDQHEVIALSYDEGMSHSEIAQRLELPLGTVKSRMRLAYHKMREAVEDLKP